MTEPSDNKHTGVEKRVQGIRLRKYIDVVIEDPACAMLLRAAIADISQTGLRVIADQYLPKGSKYTFTMKSPPNLSLRGEVRWVRDFERETYQVGIQLVDVNEEDRKRLANFLDMEKRRLATPG